MASNQKKHREPLIHISKRDNLPGWAATIGSVIVFALVILSLLAFTIWKKQPKKTEE